MDNGQLSTLLVAVLLSGLCGFCDDVSTAPEEPPPQPPPEVPPPPPEPNETELELDRQWELINNDNAETHCLEQSRLYAVKEGYPSFLIYGCECTPDEGPDVKSYDCEISAADGKHDVTISCVKAAARCTIISETGIEYYTFEELEGFLT